MHKIHTLVISDIHLGTDVSHKDKVLEVLKNNNYENLIINGDLFDSESFHRYNKDDWKILNKIRKIAKTKKVIFIKGNHDPDVDFLAAITGMELVDNYAFQINGVNFFAEHGDKYDYYITHRPLITTFFTGLYYYIQKAKVQKLSRFLKRSSKSWIRAKDIVRDKFIQKHHKDADVLLAGHTHYSEEYHDAKTNTTYINSGSFCDDVCSWIEIDEYGKAYLTYS